MTKKRLLIALPGLVIVLMFALFLLQDDRAGGRQAACGLGLGPNLRAALGAADLEVMEKRMFGGCCLMWRGHMLAVARGDRGGHGAFARVGAQAMPRALALPGAAPMVMRGRPTADFVHVPRETALDPAHAGALIGMALDFVGRLPAK